MKIITLYRDDFKTNPDDGDSFFDDVCRDLGLNPKDVDESVEISVNEVIETE